MLRSAPLFILSYLLCTGLSPNSQILANDIGIGVDSQSRPLRHGDPSIYRRRHATIELRFEIEVAPLDHCILRCRAQPSHGLPPVNLGHHRNNPASR